MDSFEDKYWNADKSRIARRSLKLQCVMYLGGYCSKCSYSKCIDALSFHHVDPAHKDFTISKVPVTKGAFDKIKPELDKCVLLCNNCHAETHYFMRAEATMETLDLFEVED